MKAWNVGPFGFYTRSRSAEKQGFEKSGAFKGGYLNLGKLTLYFIQDRRGGQ